MNEETIISINIVALSSDLAHDQARDEMIRDGIINDEEDMWTEDDPDEHDSDKHYTDEAQEVHTRWYDYFYDMILKAEEK